jgi:hypothetical protein
VAALPGPFLENPLLAMVHLLIKNQSKSVSAIFSGNVNHIAIYAPKTRDYHQFLRSGINSANARTSSAIDSAG